MIRWDEIHGIATGKIRKYDDICTIAPYCFYARLREQAHGFRIPSFRSFVVKHNVMVPQGVTWMEGKHFKDGPVTTGGSSDSTWLTLRRVFR